MIASIAEKLKLAASRRRVTLEKILTFGFDLVVTNLHTRRKERLCLWVPMEPPTAACLLSHYTFIIFFEKLMYLTSVFDGN